MDAAEHATMLANAISEGINYLAYIRSLLADPTLATAEDLSEWSKALDEFQASEKIAREGHIDGCVIVSSPPMSGALLHCMEEVRAHLATIEPGTQLPESLFQLVELAWAEFEKFAAEAQAIVQTP